MSKSLTVDASPNWEPEFEHIPWYDIVEADEEGNMDKLQNLKDRSLDLKHSMSCPEPDIRSGLENTDTPSFRAPHNTPLSNSRPFQEWEDSEYPCLPSQMSSTPSLETTSPSVLSYADALGPRVTKRTMADRTCLSPIDYLPKRSARSDTVKDPHRLCSRGTQLSPTMTKLTEDVMDIGTTPNNDSRASKAAIAVQRRLFAPAKENREPNSSKLVRPEARSRSGSVSSVCEKEAPSEHQVAKRQKQIEFGKNTLGYQRYIQTIPRWERSRDDPWTPDKSKSCSTRAWQGQVRVWRRALHKYDPPTHTESSFFTPEEAALCHMEILND